MKLNSLKIIILLAVLISGCTENKKLEPTIDKTLFNIKSEQAKEFLFVGRERERAGIYEYDFIRKTIKKYWSDKKEKIILLNYSPDLKNLYFLTAKYLGIRSTLPYIKRIKLYKINLQDKKTVFVDTLINGTQINAEWINNNSYKVIINSRDLRISEYMNKYTFIYNKTGKKLLSEIETVNFIKKGYPLPVIRQKQQLGNKNYKLMKGIVDRDSLYLFNKNTAKKYFVVNLNGMNINKISWRNDYLIFTINAKDKGNKLIIYSLREKSIVKKITGENVKNFFVFGKYLVYDLGLSFSSSISIFNLEKLELTDSIKFKNGCGLRAAF